MFNIYISKVLKKISENSGLTFQAKTKLNKFLNIISIEIGRRSISLTQFFNRKTLSCREIKSILTIIFAGKLLENSIKKGEKAINTFTASVQTNKSSRQNKADIIFPPSLLEKFLRNFNMSNIMIGKTTSIFLAAVIEYLCSYILEHALPNLNKRVRLRVIDIDYALQNNHDLRILCDKLNIELLGGFIIPYISPKFDQASNVSLREIKIQQAAGYNLVLCKKPFNNLIKVILKDLGRDKIKIAKIVNNILQHFIEKSIIELLFKANTISLHSNRMKVTPSDIKLVSTLKHGISIIKCE